jgi:hypothetical protein
LHRIESPQDLLRSSPTDSTCGNRRKFRKHNRPALNRNPEPALVGCGLAFRYALPALGTRGGGERPECGIPRQDPNAGEVVERSKAPVLKTGDPRGSVGSNPTLSAIGMS